MLFSRRFCAAGGLLKPWRTGPSRCVPAASPSLRSARSCRDARGRPNLIAPNATSTAIGRNGRGSRARRHGQGGRHTKPHAREQRHCLYSGDFLVRGAGRACTTTLRRRRWQTRRGARMARLSATATAASRPTLALRGWLAVRAGSDKRWGKIRAGRLLRQSDQPAMAPLRSATTMSSASRLRTPSKTFERESVRDGIAPEAGPGRHRLSRGARQPWM